MCRYCKGDLWDADLLPATVQRGTFFQIRYPFGERFAPERQLGRLKQFTTYYAAPFTFGHHLAATIQTSKTLEQAKQRAADFFARCV